MTSETKRYRDRDGDVYTVEIKHGAPMFAAAKRESDGKVVNLYDLVYVATDLIELPPGG